MKEKIHTIPVNEAFDSGDECPFCYLQRQAERRVLRFVAGPGASYMEPEVRAETDRLGFCPSHMQKLYDYGNTLGAALILQTHYAGILLQLQEKLEEGLGAPKRKLFQRKQPKTGTLYWEDLREKVHSCYICEKIDYNMDGYYRTFFHLLKEPEFRGKVENCKGFCLGHFAKLLELEENLLHNSQREWFHHTVLPKMEQELVRVKEDLDWFIAKHNYCNAGEPWGNAQDALPRAMQKMAGIHPSDKPYKAE